MIQYAGAARNASPLISQLLSENIYLQFCNKESFAAFRLRKGQDTARIFNFMPVFKCMKTVNHRRAPQGAAGHNHFSVSCGAYSST